MCKYYREAQYTTSPFEVKTHRGHTVSVPFNFCPVCGKSLVDGEFEDWKEFFKEEFEIDTDSV